MEHGENPDPAGPGESAEQFLSRRERRLAEQGRGESEPAGSEDAVVEPSPGPLEEPPAWTLPPAEEPPAAEAPPVWSPPAAEEPPAWAPPAPADTPAWAPPAVDEAPAAPPAWTPPPVDEPAAEAPAAPPFVPVFVPEPEPEFAVPAAPSAAPAEPAPGWSPPPAEELVPSWGPPTAGEAEPLPDEASAPVGDPPAGDEPVALVEPSAPTAQDDGFDPFAELGFETGPAPRLEEPEPLSAPADDSPFVQEAAAIPLADDSAPAPFPEEIAFQDTGAQPDISSPFVEEPPAPESGALAVLPDQAGAEGSEAVLQPTGAVPPVVGATTPLTDYTDIARPRGDESLALVLGLLLPPVGLIASIGAAIRSSRSRGFVIGLNKLAIVVSLLMCLLVGFIVYSVWQKGEEDRAFQELVATSAPFCSAATADPLILEQPLFSWPRQGDTINETIEAMEEFADRWDGLVALAPEGVSEGVSSIAARGRELLGNVEASRQVDDEQNVQVMLQTIQASGVSEWVDTYCVPAE